MKNTNNQKRLHLAELKDSLKAKAPATFHAGPKQIRATIRLSKEGHNAIERISAIRKIKNAEVFKSILDVAEILKNGKNFSITPDTKNETIRKTYVINKDTFLQLTKIATELKTSRDVLIDKTAALIDVLLDTEMQERADKYSKYIEKLNSLLNMADEIRIELKKEVAENDPVLDDLSTMCAAMSHHIGEMGEYVYKKAAS